MLIIVDHHKIKKNRKILKHDNSTTLRFSITDNIIPQRTKNYDDEVADVVTTITKIDFGGFEVETNNGYSWFNENISHQQEPE